MKAAAYDNGAALLVSAPATCHLRDRRGKKDTVVADHLPNSSRAPASHRRRLRPVRYAAHRGSDTRRASPLAGLDVLDVPSRYVSSGESALISLANRGLSPGR